MRRHHDKLHSRCAMAARLGVILLVPRGGELLAQPVSNQGNWEIVGTHPDAAAQPSGEGRELRKLQPFDGKLYAAFGDENWNDNEGTGPIAVTPYDPGAGDFVNEFSMPAEAIDHYVVIGDQLYIPNVDHHPDFSSLDAFAVSGPWRLGQSVEPFVHAYDIATTDGIDLYLVGGYGPSGASAKVERSTDGGASWEIILSVEPSGNYARFYCAGVFDEKLYVQADEWGSLHTSSHVFDGVSWSDGPRIPFAGTFGQHSVELAGRMVFHGQSGLTAFDGVSSSVVGSAYQDFFVDGVVLYYLQSSGEISHTEDLQTFTPWGAAPVGARSIAVLDGVLYVGDASSRLHRFMTAAPADAGAAGDVATSDAGAVVDSGAGDAIVTVADSGVAVDAEAPGEGGEAGADGGCGCGGAGESGAALSAVAILLLGAARVRRGARPSIR